MLYRFGGPGLEMGGPGFRRAPLGHTEIMSYRDEPLSPESSDVPVASSSEKPASASGAASARSSGSAAGSRAPNMLPGRERRRLGAERLIVRVVATGGVVGIGVALAAILAASKVQGWIIGLVVALVSVVLSGVLWSSRQL